MITEKDMPNIIITGVPGIGKTTTIKCIAHGLYGKYYRDAVLELNASDERGIDITEYTQSLGGHTGANGHGMLLRNAHIKRTVRHFLHHEFQGRS